ncbi:MAG: ABC transporter ATP-binding protein [Pseudomonadota bacterium]|nr:ABC transporter ATP-binding protein [Pseudomonadota bacterium]
MIAKFFDWLESRVETFPEALPDKPPRTMGGFIWHYTRPFAATVAASSVLAIIVAIIEVALFAWLGELVDWMTESTPAAFMEERSWQLVTMGLVVLVLYPFTHFLSEAVIHQGVYANFSMRIRWEGHRWLLRQSMGFFQDDFAGRIAARLMQTAIAVREVVMKLAEVLMYVSVYFVSAVILFASNDWRMAVPMLLWLVGYVSALRYFVPRMGRASQAQADARALVTGRVVDSYTNIGTVKMFAHASYEDDYARAGMVDFRRTIYRSMRLTTGLTTAMNVLNTWLIFGVAATGIWLWHDGAITTGAIALAVGLVMRLVGMSHWVMWEAAGLFENIGVVQDGRETLGRERSVVDRPGATALVADKGGIRFDGVRFDYGRTRPDAEGAVIDGLDLAIRPGEKVGLVGRSGAGKSTMVSLLLRFHDLEGGRILIDGTDIADVTQESLRAHVGMVTQDTSLLHRSVRENIAYGRGDATDAQVIAAARQAEAHEFILELADAKGRTGYDAHVGERGVKLSGGQRQRIAIARVLLKNAPILILDEATSALDSEVEAAIQQSLYRLMEGKTVIAIAHRLSTIAAMDRLVVMDRGRIVEEGSHDELIRRGGLYADLWARQSGGFIARDAAD